MQLEPLEPVQLLLDLPLVGPVRSTTHPCPFLDLQLAVRAVRLEIDGGDDLVADQHRQGEIPEHTLLLRQIGLETVFIVEEQLQPFALDDEGVEGGSDM